MSKANYENSIVTYEQVREETNRLVRQLVLIRKEKGLSIRQVANKVDISPSTLSRIERLLCIPNLEVVIKLAKALNTPLIISFLYILRRAFILYIKANISIANKWI